MGEEGGERMEAFIHGMILAFGLILPLGVQNVFVFNQGARQRKFFLALPVVVTASICDTLLILLAVFGVSVVVLTVDWLKMVLFAVGFIFLLYMGLAIWRSSSEGTDSGTEAGLPPKKQIIFAASVSLLNPHAILDTIGVIGTNSLQYAGYEKALYTLATIIVSWVWFFGLAIAGRMLGKIDQNGIVLRVMNKLSALIIWGVALYMAWQLISEMGGK